MTRVDLNQEQVDLLASHLTDTLIYDVAVLEALRELPDIEYGRGEIPLDVPLGCQKCKDEIYDEEMMGTSFGHFYHDGCVPDVEEGPLPAAQYVAGAGEGPA